MPVLNIFADPETFPVALQLLDSLEEHSIALDFVIDFIAQSWSPSAVVVTPVALVYVNTPRIGCLDEASSIRQFISTNDSVSVALHETVGVFLTLCSDRDQITAFVGFYDNVPELVYT